MFMEEPLSKDHIVRDIVEKVEDLGFCIEKNRVISFIDNFQEKYDRLPEEFEIKPIVLSYMKICEEEEENNTVSDESYEIDTLNYEVFDKDIYNDINSRLSSELNQYRIEHGQVLTIPKPEGRRLCPICGDANLYKIHEIIDKEDLLCSYPKIYGKKYTCDQCGVVWKEK